MKLDPHPKPVRIRLSIEQQNGNGKVVYFGLDDLLKNFDFQSLIPHIVDQSLMRWLEQLRREDIAGKIKQIIESGIDDNDKTISEDENYEQIVEQNKYPIISSLFGEIIKEEMNSDEKFLSILLKLSSEYKGTIKNVLNSAAFSEYSEYEFLKSLIQSCDTSLSKLIEKQLEFLQNKENERKERIEQQKRETAKRNEIQSLSTKEICLNAEFKYLYAKFDDIIQKVHFATNQRVKKGDKIITLRHEDVIAPCNGRIYWLFLGPGNKYHYEVSKGSRLALLTVE